MKRYTSVVFMVTLLMGVISWTTRHVLHETIVTVLFTALCAVGGLALVAWVKRSAEPQPDNE
ncbi:hypothetical protein [Cellulomonas sp. URHE0023]|uniref:hypothetical protein n=1 Tax=Cellulomonas sp. URHE0023 TaxID=1380354 RepID=UPI0012DE7AAC|nr:hypothetical protein [Cellulomonas sp. URHE0023]